MMYTIRVATAVCRTSMRDKKLKYECVIKETQTVKEKLLKMKNNVLI